jgi:hypothetical protein
MKNKNFMFFALALLTCAVLVAPIGRVKAQDDDDKSWHFLSLSCCYISAYYNTEGNSVQLRFTRKRAEGFNYENKRIEVFFAYTADPGQGVLGTPDSWMKDSVTLQGGANNHADKALLVRGKQGFGGAQSFCVRLRGYRVEGEEYEEEPSNPNVCVSKSGERSEREE